MYTGSTYLYPSLFSRSTRYGTASVNTSYLVIQNILNKTERSERMRHTINVLPVGHSSEGGQEDWSHLIKGEGWVICISDIFHLHSLQNKNESCGVTTSTYWDPCVKNILGQNLKG